MNGNSLPQDRVQALHLIPRQDAESPALIRGITARHIGVNFPNPRTNKLKLKSVRGKRKEKRREEGADCQRMSDSSQRSVVSRRRAQIYSLSSSRPAAQHAKVQRQKCACECASSVWSPIRLCAAESRSVCSGAIHKKVLSLLFRMRAAIGCCVWSLMMGSWLQGTTFL